MSKITSNVTDKDPIQQLGSDCDDFISTIQEISKLMKDAHFNLTLAKQSFPVGHLGPSMYDKRMKATKGISFDETSNSFQLSNTLRNSSSSSSPSSNHHQSQPQEEKGDEMESGSIKNPIQWYGILVPSTLKQSQKQFDIS